MAYDSEQHPDLEDSSLAEQKNSIMAEVRSLAVNMTQDTCLWFVRHKLYMMNKVQRDKNAGRCFWSRRKNHPIIADAAA